MVSLSAERAGLVSVVGLLLVGFGFAGCFVRKPCCFASSAVIMLHVGISTLYQFEIMRSYT